MATKKPKKTYQKLHPIQIVSLGVSELFIKANQPPDLSVEYDDRSFSMFVGHTSYDPKKKSIQVTLKLEVGTDESSDHPFSMKIKLIGDFIVKEDEFPMDQVEDWARRNAPFILYPYIREHAFALTARCGFRPILLPLLEVPTLVVRKKSPKPPVATE